MSITNYTARYLAAALAEAASANEIITALNLVAPNTVLNSITAQAGGAQAGATPLTGKLNRITTVTTAGDSTLLPLSTAGTQIFVISTSANSSVVFPTSPDVIQGLAATRGYNLPGGGYVQFVCVVAGTWNIVASSFQSSSWSTGTTTTTFTAGQLTGGGDVTYTSTATTPGSIATRTATQMFDDTPGAIVGMTYVLTVINLSGSANTMTITAGSGVTLTGTATVAQNIARVYQVTFTSSTALTIQEMYAYTAAA